MIKYKKFYKTNDYEKVCESSVLQELFTYPKITLYWGAEYVHFVKFREILYPSEGSSSILGIMIPLMGYDIAHFKNLLEEKKPSNILVFYENLLSNKMLEIFDVGVVEPYKDYSEAITYLEEKGYVATIPSISDLRTDERRFSFLPKVYDILSPELVEKYGERVFEVDSLGSSFFKELSDLISSLVS